ncbi:glycosyltransferase [Virgibacillus kimchii]
MKEIKVSVIMGIYNCEDTLKRCIDSILNQSYVNWELIMCDDASSDGTYDIAKEYADNYNNITLIKNEKNLGLAATLNRCISITKGRYIARTDADDICLPNRFEKQVDFLDSNPEYDVVGSSVILFDEDGDKGLRKNKKNPGKYTLITSVPFGHPTIMMKKSVYTDLGGYTVSERTRRGQDRDLWFRFYHKGFKGYNIQEPLYKYHESIDDYKKRNLTVAINRIRTSYLGFKLLKFPKRYYFFLLKPLIAALLPNSVMYRYHKRKSSF